MQASPLRTHRRPGYPTRLEINANPELLCHQIPATWSARPELATAAALLLTLALPGCQSQPAAKDNSKPTAIPASGLAVVAPLFEHGDGRSWFGCVVVTPPTFLSEEEAWKIIDAELATRGITLTEKGHLIPGVEIPLYLTSELEALKEGEPLPKPSSIEVLKADRADPTRKIALEFISTDNPPEKAAVSGGLVEGITIGSIEYKGAAEILLQKVATASTEKCYFGVLYDPVVIPDYEHNDEPRLSESASQVDRDRYYERLNARAKAESKRLLRLQVRDFIKWLQAQGAI